VKGVSRSALLCLLVPNIRTVCKADQIREWGSGWMMSSRVWIAAAVLVAAVLHAEAQTTTSHSVRNIPLCGSAKRITCIVDGDTVWIEGEKIRLEGFNSPEVNGQCGREKELARQATDELQRILSSEPFSITRNDRD